MAHAQKPDFVFRQNGRVHLNRQRRQFSRLLAAEVCASAVVMLDTPSSEVVWRVLATHSIRQVPLHFPSLASPFAITFQLDSTTDLIPISQKMVALERNLWHLLWMPVQVSSYFLKTLLTSVAERFKSLWWFGKRADYQWNWASMFERSRSSTKVTWACEILWRHCNSAPDHFIAIPLLIWKWCNLILSTDDIMVTALILSLLNWVLTLPNL